MPGVFIDPFWKAQMWLFINLEWPDIHPIIIIS